MSIISPKIEIINHFDNLINKLDIDIELSFEKYKKEQLLSEIVLSSETDRRNYEEEYNKLDVEFHETVNTSKNRSQTVDLWSESTKVIDYLNQVRMRTIEELRKAQEDSLEYYKLNSSRFKLTKEKKIDQLKSELFSETFYFQIHYTKKRLWAFNLFTFATNFYMPPSDINILEKFINAEEEPFDLCYTPVFDEKMVLICLLYKYFVENLLNFPNHVIRVCKEDVSNIETISYEHSYSGVNLTGSSSIDLSKLVNLYLIGSEEHTDDRKELNEYIIEGLTSLRLLKLSLNSTEQCFFSIRNLYSLKSFNLSSSSTIDESMISELFRQLESIEELSLFGNFSYINMDNLVNLKRLIFACTLNEKFNFELLKKLCIQLEDLSICIDLEDSKNINNDNILKLLNDLHFPFLQILSISNSNIKKVTNKFFSKFPVLRELYINNCNLEIIENDAFAQMKQLVHLDLNTNLLVTLKKEYFSQLINLENLILSENRLEFIEDYVFSNLKSARKIDLSKNKLSVLYRESFIGSRTSVEIFLHDNNLNFLNE